MSVIRVDRGRVSEAGRMVELALASVLLRTMDRRRSVIVSRPRSPRNH
jgi:hypothetical protein